MAPIREGDKAHLAPKRYCAEHGAAIHAVSSATHRQHRLRRGRRLLPEACSSGRRRRRLALHGSGANISHSHFSSQARIATLIVGLLVIVACEPVVACRLSALLLPAPIVPGVLPAATTQFKISPG